MTTQFNQYKNCSSFFNKNNTIISVIFLAQKNHSRMYELVPLNSFRVLPIFVNLFAINTKKSSKFI